MKEKTVEMGDFTLDFTKDESNWQFTLPKSQTRIKYEEQLDLLNQFPDYFAPLDIEEIEDAFQFSMRVQENYKDWAEIRKLNTNDKLRLLCNVTKLEQFLDTRMTFFLHPETIVFDENLMPIITYRGLRNVVPPFESDKALFLRQFKCFAIALFSTKYDFDQLYNGSLRNVDETEFQRHVRDMEDLTQLKLFLQKAYREEQEKTEKTMSWVPLKKYRLFRQLAMILIGVTILLAIPLAYYGLVKSPYQDKLLAAHGYNLSSDYNGIISTLRDVDPEGLPIQTKFILANAYINVENFSEDDKENILRNVSLKSDPDYLLYWIYNGRGEFEESMDKAKYIEDGQLIIYGLIQQIEATRNNPELTGTEKEERMQELQDELVGYQEQYDLIEEENSDSGAAATEEVGDSPDEADDTDDSQVEAESEDESEKETENES